VGAALTQKLNKTGKVAVAFSGDGASNQGTTFEALNMAVVLGAPAIFAFENNGYGEHTAASYAVGAPSIADRARSFGMPAEVVDGSDFFAVHQAMARALERGRAGEGPYALELTCSRFLGHFVGDPQPYRTPEELAQARGNDPIPRFRKGVTEAALLEDADLDAIEKDVLAEVEHAVQTALAAPMPNLNTLETDVYVRY
jgi:pyruvate dehydrogenase E1 component alpha subunit